MAKGKTHFVCQECGCSSPKWVGRCPECGAWNTFAEEKIPEKTSAAKTAKGRGPMLASKSMVRPLKEVQTAESSRIDTGIDEVNRVLGGGLVPGSLILLSGDPGIGKSTLAMQIMAAIKTKSAVLYISGEESAGQIQNRAQRLGIAEADIVLLTENDIEKIHETILSLKPGLIVLDSIQTTFDPALTAAPGSVSQLRAVTAYGMEWSKNLGIVTILIGHVTKDGQVAGPRVLEHMVDAVLFFEGDPHYQYRVLRALKNRFGSTNEIGLFDMEEDGLKEILNPSEAFLAERPEDASGSAIAAILEGTRPILVEIQGLVTPSVYGQPRRMATGTDYNRVNKIMAILEQRAGLPIGDRDVYVNLVGGLTVEEPAIDLGIAVAVASAFLNKIVRRDTILIGELGLTGELRQVQQIERRLREIQKLGYHRAIVPALRKPLVLEGVEIIEAKNLKEVFQAVWE